MAYAGAGGQHDDDAEADGNDKVCPTKAPLLPPFPTKDHNSICGHTFGFGPSVGQDGLAPRRFVGLVARPYKLS